MYTCSSRNTPPCPDSSTLQHDAVRVMDYENTSPTTHSARYKPLADADLETEPGELKWALRCVAVAPGHGSEPVRCKLVDFTLGRAQHAYEAYSYAWDDRTHQATIHLDGEPLHVTQNLEAALRCLRRPGGRSDCSGSTRFASTRPTLPRSASRFSGCGPSTNTPRASSSSEETADTVRAVALVETMARDVKVGDRDRITSMLGAAKARGSRLALQRADEEPLVEQGLGRAGVLRGRRRRRLRVREQRGGVVGGLWKGAGGPSSSIYRFNAVIPPRQGHLMREMAATPVSHLWTARREYQATKPKPKPTPTPQKRVPLSLLYRFRGFRGLGPQGQGVQPVPPHGRGRGPEARLRAGRCRISSKMGAARHDALHGRAKIYNDAIYSALAGRSFFATEKGRIGLADNPADAGDVVGVFPGSRVLCSACERRRPGESQERLGHVRIDSS
ncbi:hypothetical protein CTA2_9907 [Colletotrichum tanaceti]|nr:hypothetical protein CTA2_9907 [Colletotrichum tanaceti]